MTPEEKLKSMGLELPKVPTPMGNYVPYKLSTARRSISRGRVHAGRTDRRSQAASVRT